MAMKNLPLKSYETCTKRVNFLMYSEYRYTYIYSKMAKTVFEQEIYHSKMLPIED